MKNLVRFTLLDLHASHIAWKQWDRNSASSDLSTLQIQTLAATVKTEDVAMYSTTEYPYCHAQNG